MRRAHAFKIGLAVALALSTAGAVHGYQAFASWPTSTVVFYVNPANADVSASAAIAGVQEAMDIWNRQSGTPFRFNYGGTVGDTAIKVDNRNVAIFRPNYSSGSTIASTYTWRDGSNKLVDADVTFYTTDWTFYVGTSGCSGTRGIYIEDIGAHEFGHALGLNHSSLSDATMYPSTSYCSQAWRTLASDDIAGARALYGTGTTNTAPTVSISNPVSGASFAAGTAVSFTGSAFDTQDGNISASLQWTDNGTAVFQGASFSRVLTAGTHTIVARSTDSAGAQGSRQISVTATSTTSGTTSGTTSSGSTLKVTGRKVKGYQQADLAWNGLSATSIDVYRNNAKVMSTANDGVATDPINKKGSASYTYKVCAVGTTTCSNTASVTF